MVRMLKMNETGGPLMWAGADIASTTAISAGGLLCLN
ncbi:MAG: hypothetical protein ACI9GE_000337 [Oceanospirillaceae bacterium]|jgi:hypothetical protein